MQTKIEDPYEKFLSNNITELQAELRRLTDIINRAKAESEFVEIRGRSMVAVPYWFIKS